MTTPLRASSSALLVALTLLACAKSDPAANGNGTAPSASATASATPGSPRAANSAACDVVTCANFMGAPSYVSGHATTIADAPPAPGAPSLCGSSTAFGPTNYYTTTASPSDVIAYYEKQLPSRGFTVKPRKDGIHPCSIELSFHKKPMELGNVIAWVGGFSVMYAGK